MRFKLVLFAVMTSVSAAQGAPVPLWGPHTKLYTDFECLPPIPLHDFATNLRDGTLKNAIPWSQLMELQVDPSSRLIFEQRDGLDFVAGVFISAQDGETLDVREADALTGTAATLDLVRIAPRKGPMAVTPFIENLTALNQDHHLFRMQPGYFQKLDSRVFRSIMDVGTLIFTHQVGAMVLSPDLKQVSLCVKVDSYEDTSHRHEWLVLDAADFDNRAFAKIALHFTEDPKVTAMLSCEELLAH